MGPAHVLASGSQSGALWLEDVPHQCLAVCDTRASGLSVPLDITGPTPACVSAPTPTQYVDGAGEPFAPSSLLGMLPFPRCVVWGGDALAPSRHQSARQGPGTRSQAPDRHVRPRPVGQGLVGGRGATQHSRAPSQGWPLFSQLLWGVHPFSTRALGPLPPAPPPQPQAGASGAGNGDLLCKPGSQV